MTIHPIPTHSCRPGHECPTCRALDQCTDTDTPADTLRALHGLMTDEGLFSKGMERYWHSIYDALVYELAPELARADA